MSDRNTEEFKSWLDKMQQDSWQLELLISGFAIFGLMGAYGPLQSLITYVFLQPDYIFGFILTLGVLLLNAAWIVFTVNLIIHVFLRGLWIGTLGLRYVSGDIDYEDLNYNERFTSRFKKKIGSFDDYIEKLERYSSIMFAYTFLLFFIFLSALSFLCFFVMLVLLFTFLLGGEIRSAGISLNTGGLFGFILLVTTILVLLSAICVTLDFLLLGSLKKIKNRFLSKIYYVMNRFISMVSLSFLWRPMLLNFLDQKFTKILVFSAIPYGLIIAVLAPNIKMVNNEYYPSFDNDKYDYIAQSFHPMYYDDERAKRGSDESVSIRHFCLPSKVVDAGYLEVFVKHNVRDNKLIQFKDSTIYPLQLAGMKTLFSEEDKITHKEKDFRKKLFEKQLELFSEKWKQDSLSSEEQIEKKGLLEKEFSKQEKIYDEQNLKKLKNLIASFSRFYINNKAVDPAQVNAQFYEHPMLKEKGVLFHIFQDSLDRGVHQLRFDREIYVGQVDTISFTIPFVYNSAN